MNAPDPSIIQTLHKGKIAVEGEFMWGSNYTFLVNVEHEGQSVKAVYKPTRGERPLWDFPTGTLGRREVAAFQVSEALKWELVPYTLYRGRGPAGPGSLQLHVEHDPNHHYFVFTEEERDQLRPTVLFDLLINNADRKGSHILIGPQAHLWLIDHGVCFHVEDKLRTVVWDFVGEPIPEALIEDLKMLWQDLQPRQDTPSPLAEALLVNLSRGEVNALAERARALTEIGCFPAPDPLRRPFPWPQI